MNNLRQVGVTLQLYRIDSNGELPGTDGGALSAWAYLLLPYVSSNLLYMPTACPSFYRKSNPSQALGSIQGNINLVGSAGTLINGAGDKVRRPLSEVRSPSTTFLLTHGINIAASSPTHLDQSFFNTTYNPPYDGTGLNFYFADEHVEFIPYQGQNESRWWIIQPIPCRLPEWTYDGYRIFGP